jgi:P4 family phage/plasmid primase-like protien
LNGAEGPPPEELLVFSNGILWVHGYLWGRKNAPVEDYFFPHTPDLFHTFALPFPFDPTAKCRRYTFKVKQMLGGDYDKVGLYQEWGGYLLLPTNKFQKFLVMKGPKGAGKTVLLNVLGAMMGDNCAAPNFHNLASEFGLHDLVGQQVALMDEAKMTKSTDTMQALETLLKITGGAPFNIPRKYQQALRNYKFPTRFTMTCNSIPNLPDPDNALQRRLMILDFPIEFTGKEDPDLENKLCQELPGVILWHLQGYKRLIDNNKFTQPAGMLDALKEWATTTNPLAAFVEECCEEGEGRSVNKTEIFDAWHQWSQEHGFRPLSKSRIFERLKGASQYITSETYEKGGHKHSVFKGIKLKPWAERRLLGKPDEGAKP